MIDRRQLVASVAAAALGAHPALARTKRRGDHARALNRLLDRTSEALLAEYPDDATFLGLDKGPRAALHGKLTDRSIEADAARGASCAARLKALKTGLYDMELVA